MAAKPMEAGEAPTFLRLIASSASLRLTCRDCAATCWPNVGKIAVRLGIRSAFDDSVKIRCDRCSSRNTLLQIRYPSMDDESACPP